MKVSFCSVMVDDQSKALAFYTEKLGFQLKHDIPMGEFRWLTVVSPAAPEGAELLLEPTAFPPAKDFKRALYEAGVPATAFEVEDLRAEYERLRALGVVFKGEPSSPSGTMPGFAKLDDGCGNWIHLFQPARS
jgi:catechol 2,3-dioxygenase-like lactoylglutathione lyase family enzyme